jgi:glycosyltransferase involved in cell wall biosynthesis
VIRESISPIGFLREKRFARLWLWLYRHSYPRADAIIALSPSLHHEIEEVCQKPLPELQVIANPYPVVSPTDRGLSDGKWRRLISIGRLEHQKGYDLLLYALAKLKSRHVQLSLVLVGRGPDELTLKGLASSLDISDRVSFIGWTANPLDVLAQADIYVLSSRYEGVSNAMLEAISLGLPVVATTEHTSAADFIEDGVNGVLVRDTSSEALATAIDRAVALCRSNSWSFLHKSHTEEEMLEEFGELMERLSICEDSTVSTGENT